MKTMTGITMLQPVEVVPSKETTGKTDTFMYIHFYMPPTSHNLPRLTTIATAVQVRSGQEAEPKVV